MAKGGDLWDDSALIDAFDNAIYSYKKIHKKKNQDSRLDNNGEVMSAVDNVATKIKDENAAALSTQAANGLTGVEEWNDLPLVTEDPAPETSADSATKGITFDHHSADFDRYNQLLGQYYEREASRQRILEQLSCYGDLNYQNYGASQVNPSSEMAGGSSFPQSACQVACPAEICCCCSYICPTSTVPFMQSFCSAGSASGIQNHSNADIGSCGITRTAMEAAGKAMSSLKVKVKAIRR